MKNLFTLIAAVLVTASVFAQSPNKMSYQAVIRNADNNLVTNTSVGMQISILQTSANGVAVYTETQTPTTNANGLISVEIGMGDSSDDFSTIDWASGIYFIKTETDPTGGTNYTITGVSQLLSVPYALHAKTAETISGTINVTESDPTFTSSEAANITASDITNLSTLSGTNTGDQDLSGLLTNETDPEFTNSKAAQITDAGSGVVMSQQERYKLGRIEARAEVNVRSDWKASSGDAHIINKPILFTTADESDPVYSGSEASNITAGDITNLGNLSNTNSGDQDLSALATKTALSDSTALVRSEIPDVSGFLSAETDPTYTGSEAANITATDITNLGNLSNTNSGDQDLSALAIKTALSDSIALVRSEIPDVSGFLSSETQTISDVAALNNSVNSQLKNVTDPTDAQDAATKAYIDNLIIKVGVTAKLLANGFSLQQLIDGGHSVSELVSGGASMTDLVSAGFTESEFIGSSYQGGIIAYISQAGDPGYVAGEIHGLIAAKTDQSGGVPWYHNVDVHLGADGDSLYAGRANTAIIVERLKSEYLHEEAYAAIVCDNYSVTVDGLSYNDWYLPSLYELELLVAQKDAIGGFFHEYYWSSSELARVQVPFGPEAKDFTSGHVLFATSTDLHNVRAVRAF